MQVYSCCGAARCRISKPDDGGDMASYRLMLQMWNRDAKAHGETRAKVPYASLVPRPEPPQRAGWSYKDAGVRATWHQGCADWQGRGREREPPRDGGTFDVGDGALVTAADRAAADKRLAQVGLSLREARAVVAEGASWTVQEW